MADPSILIAELARLQASTNPMHQALAELYRQGGIRAAGVRDGQVVWKAVAQEASNV